MSVQHRSVRQERLTEMWVGMLVRMLPGVDLQLCYVRISTFGRASITSAAHSVFTATDIVRGTVNPVFGVLAASWGLARPVGVDLPASTVP